MNDQIKFIPKTNASKINYSLDLRWRPFIEARKFAQSLGLKSREEWEKFAKEGISGVKKPDDIPFAPIHFYKYEGWCGFNDWLGIKPKREEKFLRFKMARNFARSLYFENIMQWRLYCKGKLDEKGVKPRHIPPTPDIVYDKKGWISWNDWLGCGIVEYNSKVYEPFIDARAFVRSLNLKNVYEWFDYCNGLIKREKELPITIPASPYEVYQHYGWISWRDWLGTNTTIEFKIYQEAKFFVRSIKIKSISEWRKYCAGFIINKVPIPDDIPINPNIYYSEQWISWGDFLGTGTIATQKREYRNFEDARKYIRNLNLSGQKEWDSFKRGELNEKGELPDDISRHPNRTYKANWISWGDWLGNDNIAHARREFRSFRNARKFAQKLKIKSYPAWVKYCKGESRRKEKKPLDIPTNPDKVYKLQWQGYGDFLGTGAIANCNRTFLPFEEARVFIRKLNFKKTSEWLDYKKGKLINKGKLPRNIPTNPSRSYKEEWISWGDWFGNGNISTSKRVYRSYTETLSYIQQLDIKSEPEWRKYCRGKSPKIGKRPQDIPADPPSTYKKEWTSWGSFLGTGSIAPSKMTFWSFTKAHNFVKKLNLRKKDDWMLYSKGELANKGKRPPHIPSNPQKKYKDKWKGWKHWLGVLDPLFIFLFIFLYKMVY